METELTAYPIGPVVAEGWVVEPAPNKQEWMAQTPHQAALRCLPLLIATQAGWVIRCPAGFKVTWNGKRDAAGSLNIQWQDDPPAHHKDAVMSNFGLGIVTFKIPWLFRTSKDVCLIARGPVNYFKDNIVALEGLIETDWAPYTFTMNWKIIAPKRTVWFKKGEPICQIVPYPLKMLESVTPRFARLDDNPELMDEFLNFRDNRHRQQRAAVEAGTSEGHFRLDYVKGQNPDGTFAMGNHRSALKLSPFEAAAPIED